MTSRAVGRAAAAPAEGAHAGRGRARRPRRAAWLLLALAVAASGCRPPRAVPAPPEASVVLVSIDGFRWDYLDRGLTPRLGELAARGARARRLIPVFPTKTFPNHYSLVTGLAAGEHGVVANNIYDPELDERFGLRLDAVKDGRWYGGEPVWATAERQGLRTAALFWPGTEAEIRGYRPSEWTPYDPAMPGEERVDRVLAWLARPPETRPAFVTLYLGSAVDDAGHERGPDESPELAAALTETDGLVGRLVDGIASLPDPAVDIIVVSDHGMAQLSPERVIFLDDYVRLDEAGVVDWTPVAALWPQEADRARIHQALAGAHPALTVYRRDEIPERYAYDHRRVPPILAVADEGWSISSRGYFERHPGRYAGGNHGYDNHLDSMAAIFVAAGPSFRAGIEIERLDALAVYPLLCRLLGIAPLAGQGVEDDAARILRPAARRPAP